MMKRGELCTITNHHTFERSKWVKVKALQGEEHGWVPLNILKIGPRPAIDVQVVTKGVPIAASQANIDGPSRIQQPDGAMKVWSRTVKPGVVASFRWLPTLVQKGKPDGNTDLEGNAKLAMSLGSEKEQLQVFLPENHWIPIGHKVSVVFEIMLNGQRHPYEWARLAVIGPFTDWSTMSALAIRVEYIGPDGAMKSE